MKFKKREQNLWFLSFQNCFLHNCFAISPDPLVQNSSFTPFWKANLNTQMLRYWKLKILEKSGDWVLVSPNCHIAPNTLKHVKLDLQMIITLVQSLIWCKMVSYKTWDYTLWIFLPIILGIRDLSGTSFHKVPWCLKYPTTGETLPPNRFYIWIRLQLMWNVEFNTFDEFLYI